MKKTIVITVLAATFAATGAFGQGFFNFSSGKSQVYDGFSVDATSQLDTKVGVALFWAAASTANPFAAWYTSTPTSINSSSFTPFTIAQAWAALTGSSFVQATSTAIGGNVQNTSTSLGVVRFNGGGNFDITGTSASPTAYSLMLISYDATQYASAAAAASAGGSIGWSQVVQYTSGSSSASTLASLSFGQFGTYGTPEPTTVALAGLGGLALLGLRRRK